MERISILVADDEQEIRDLIAIHLEKEGYHVIKVSDGKEAVDVIGRQVIDLLILDIMMPNIDGYEVARQIREQHNMPIIFLSAKTSDFDKVQGLVIGADDYMTKPFAPIELVARVNAQLRRFKKLNQPKPDRITTLEFGGLVIAPEQRKVTLYGETIELTPKEFEILYLLASHPKKVYSVENIFHQVWGEAYFEGGNTVMVHVRTLRKKLKDDQRKSKWIKTVWGVGYAFNG
ncbi:response regulator transcription factor [Halalkalibacterium halodurans]|uniref:Two-component response regulator n=1 Tax=Halalkalibacterium halodurans (strain ATCC BAA-125 / DSM 18197 / FERM 7344 / JCM 9153 / C-125) TaxID=272558 RepID=Q9KBW6_HALH5|nr:response regulator transcription factor [Halalkalibacterium halodurans]MDY7222368.1 response regulator transcription factor [Halalkalibacterium halodurans]MDY7241589.1 response regulator transcription factor [Halalkalibacterium halodurans]MED4082325.1 response regulator transcription factor [Halalkalibacterium halodurans]MED4083524.1 response regulator transcription factor [Halalkalibacterium halodurans]MED4105837.1 response regulator transcription factor [Halalkalibacterium halodurans]